MPIFLSLSKHEEFESNSTLQIRIRRKEGAEAEKAEAEKEEAENFAPQCEIAFLCTVHVYVDFLTFVVHLFSFLPNLPHCNSIFFWFFLVFFMKGWL